MPTRRDAIAANVAAKIHLHFLVTIFFLIVDSSWNSARVLRARQEQATNNRGRTEAIREFYCAVLFTYGDDQWNRVAKKNGTVHSVLESTALPVSFTMPS